MFTPDLRRFAAVTLALASIALPSLAQTTPPATCTVAPKPPTALNLESTFSLSNVLSTMAPSINPQLLAAVQAGALEPRQQVTLDTTQNVVNITTFGATPGSPSPTAFGNIGFQNTLSTLSLTVQSVLTSCKPVPSVLYAGTIASNYPKTPFGDVTGATAALSIGYTTDNPPKINNVVLVIAGVATTYSAAGAGTLTFPAGSVTPPGSTNNNPIIVFSPAPTQNSAQRQVQLDASKSTSPLNLPLTYSWRQIDPATLQTIQTEASIGNGNTSTPQVTLPPIRKDYTFEVTVTDSQGNSSKGQTVITYSGN